MKHLLFLVLSIISFVTMPAAADDTTAPAQSAPSDGSTTGAQGQRLERLKQAMAALDLTDAQKDQIKQIRANSSPGQERRQQIMAVLTPDQKAKLVQMLKEYRDAAKGSTTTTANGSDN